MLKYNKVVTVCLAVDFLSFGSKTFGFAYFHTSPT